jgi:hypothetical protein
MAGRLAVFGHQLRLPLADGCDSARRANSNVHIPQAGSVFDARGSCWLALGMPELTRVGYNAASEAPDKTNVLDA